MPSTHEDLLERKQLYRHLEETFGNLRNLPPVMKASQQEGTMTPQRMYDYRGHAMLQLTFQKSAQGIQKAYPHTPYTPRSFGYIFVDLKNQKAQAAPYLSNFKSPATLNLFRDRQRLSDRLANRYGFQIQRPPEKRESKKERLAKSKERLRVRKLPLNKRLVLKAKGFIRRQQAFLKRVAGSRIVRDYGTIPLQEKPSWGQSTLGYLSRHKDLGQALQKVGVPRDQLQGTLNLSRDQQYSRFCNLCTQKELHRLYDREYRFVAKGPRRDLLAQVT